MFLGVTTVAHEEDVAATESAQGDETSGWVLVNSKMVVGLVGLVSCYAWLFLMVGTSAFVPFADDSGFGIGGGHFLFVVGILCGLVVVWKCSNLFSAHRCAQLVLAAVLSVAGIAGLWFLKDQPLLLLASSFLSGAGFGFLYPLYGEYLCLFFYGNIRSYIYGVFSCAAIVCAGLLFTGGNTGFFFALIFPAVAFVGYALQLVFFRLDEYPVVERADSDSRHHVTWRSYLSTVTSGMASGFALGCLLSTQATQSGAYVVADVLVVATCLLLLADSFKSNKVNETVTMRLFLPLSAIVVFPLLFVPDSVKFILAVLLLCGSLVPTTCSISAICKHISIFGLSAIRAFSFGRLMSFLGVALGMGVSFMGFFAVPEGADAGLAQAGSVVLFMLLVILSASFIMTEDNYPDEARLHAAEQGGAETIGAGTPIRKIEAAPAEVATPAEDAGGGASKHPNIFHLKCAIVAKKYSLSNRQGEVLLMLAKGRNADYITEKLVISSHTAKAHIYNIYQKIGVHSRQELMDVVENTDIAEAESLGLK